MIELKEGQEIPMFARGSDFGAWNRYAAVNDEFVPIHMDDEAGREAGFATAIGMGNLSFSHLHALLRDWVGEGGRIHKVSVQYKQPNLRKSTVTSHGRIVSVSPTDEGSAVELALWVDDDAGRVLLDGKATVMIRSS